MKNPDPLQSTSEAFRQMLARIKAPDSSPALTTFLNPYSFLMHHRHGTALHRFDAIHVDGFLLVWFLKLFGIRVQRRSFDLTSMAGEVFNGIEARGKTLYVIGGTESEADRFGEYLRQHHADLRVVGLCGGHFASAPDRARAIEHIVEVNPDNLVVGMGAPLQERFALDIVDAGWRGKAYTCGAFISQTAGKSGDYYPRIFDKLNLRWAYRIIDDPRYLKRYFVLYPLALGIFARKMFSIR